MDPKPGAVFLCTLTHNGQLDYMMAKAFYMTPTKERAVFWMPRQTSLLAAGCNHLWCQALNLRGGHDLKWFAMLHSDIVPEDFWIDKLIAEAEAHGADVMSCVVPIKENIGVTSTALGSLGNPYQRATRLMMKQVLHPEMPATFDVDGALTFVKKRLPNLTALHLLVNTGCFVARLDRPWCDKVHFTINDRILQQPGGSYTSEVESEDWFFSRRVAEEGGRVMATRKVRVEHIGARSYKSNEVWGEELDPATVI